METCLGSQAARGAASSQEKFGMRDKKTTKIVRSDESAASISRIVQFRHEAYRLCAAREADGIGLSCDEPVETCRILFV